MSQKRQIARFEEINELVERMQQHYEQLDGPTAGRGAAADGVDRVERQKRSGFAGPAPRVNLHEALTNNMRLGPLSPARLAQNKVKKRAVVEAEERTDFGALDLERDASAGDRTSADAAPLTAELDGFMSEPPGDGASDGGEALQAVRVERVYVEAVRVIEEEVRPNAVNPTTRGAVAELHERGPGAPRGVEASPAPARAEHTNVDFAYPEGGRYLEELAGGAVVHSGEGKSVVDEQRTRTFVLPPDKAKK